MSARMAMSRLRTAPAALAAAALLAGGCGGDRAEAADGDRWLTGDERERNARIEDQFGGFSQAMREVGYRYSELYWAIRDGNHEYAGYQAEKIDDAIERGLERRPARARSARELFIGPHNALGQLRGAIETGDADAIEITFRLVTDSCNMCHEAEDVAFIRIAPPQQRLSPARSPTAAEVTGEAEDVEAGGGAAGGAGGGAAGGAGAASTIPPGRG
jgi:hypothetical protein